MAVGREFLSDSVGHYHVHSPATHLGADAYAAHGDASRSTTFTSLIQKTVTMEALLNIS